MPQILDHRGNPIRVDKLEEELAAPTLTGIRALWHDSVASTLTPQNLAAIIEGVDRNDNLSYLTLAEEMEERDMHYQSVLSTRKLAVSGLDRHVESYSDEPKHIKHADFVRDIIRLDSFEDLVSGLLDALGKGYAAVEIMWEHTDTLWFPREYKWRDPRDFMFDLKTGRELLLIDEEDPLGIPLEPGKFCVHYPKIKQGLPIRGGLARLVVVGYMCKSYGIKDWMAFAETFGMPLRVGKHGTGATKEQIAALLRAVASIGTDAACIIPEDMMIEFIESSKVTGGENLFVGIVNWFNSEVSKAVLGQTATTEGTPGKLGSDDTQAQVREDIKLADIKQLEATIKRDLIKPLVDLNFNDIKPREYPNFRIFTEKPADLKLMSEVLPPLVKMGMDVEISVVRDKFGFPEPPKGAKLLRDPAGIDTSGDDDDEETGDEEKKKTEELHLDKQEIVTEIMHKIRNGVTLTNDQRLLLVSLMASEKIGEGDEIDKLSGIETDEWKRLMDPVLKPILDHANASVDYQSFFKGLDKVLTKMDSTELAKRLAATGFKTRGLGDGTDDV